MSGYAAADLPITIYLNQRIVFDLLATFEDGFTQVKTLISANSDEASTFKGAEGSVGLSNVFALLPVSLKASVNKAKKTTGATHEAGQKVHTPASLFSELRTILQDEELLRCIARTSDISDVRAGEFIEFRATLTNNPVLDGFRGLKEMLSLVVAFESPPAPVKQGGGKQAPAKASSQQAYVSQLEALIGNVTGSGTFDLLGRLVDAPGVTAVLSAEMSFFTDPSLNDIIDAEFHVLGKVTRVLAEGSDGSIDLLRKTGLNRFGDVLVAQFQTAFDSLSAAGLRFPNMQRQIEAPALQVIPIAVFA